VIVEGDKVRHEIRPDKHGNFRISNLPPGKFKVTLKLPEEFTIHQAEQQVSVTDRGCGAVNYYITDNGHVGGRVFDAEGQPIAEILLSLVDPDANPKTDAINFTRTDKDGRFEFTPVRAGRYVIAINYGHYPDPNHPAVAYPPAFYPGVTDRPQAEVITLGLGEKLTDLNIRMPPRRPAGVINGQVVRPDGSPLPSAALMVADLTEATPKIVLGIKLDEQGRFTIKGYIGQKFGVGAGIFEPGASISAPPKPIAASAPQRITIEHATQTIKLVVPMPSN